MKITDVRAHHIRIPYDAGPASFRQGASAISALDMVVIEDCCASYPEDWHEWSIRNIMPLLATVTTSDAVLAALGAGKES